MTKDERQEVIEHIQGSPIGEAVRGLIGDMIEDLDSVDGVNSTEEILGRQFAIKKLKRLSSHLKEQGEEKSKGSEYK